MAGAQHHPDRVGQTQALDVIRVHEKGRKVVQSNCASWFTMMAEERELSDGYRGKENKLSIS